jgi:hypothetical protein
MKICPKRFGPKWRFLKSIRDLSAAFDYFSLAILRLPLPRHLSETFFCGTKQVVDHLPLPSLSIAADSASQGCQIFLGAAYQNGENEPK